MQDRHPSSWIIISLKLLLHGHCRRGRVMEESCWFRICWNPEVTQITSTLNPLIQTSLIPNSKSVLQHAKWLIGNHWELIQVICLAGHQIFLCSFLPIPTMPPPFLGGSTQSLLLSMHSSKHGGFLNNTPWPLNHHRDFIFSVQKMYKKSIFFPFSTRYAQNQTMKHGLGNSDNHFIWTKEKV